MSKKIFTPEQMNELSTNEYVKNITEKGITYTDEYKEHFIKEREKGKLVSQIFKKSGFDTEVLDSDRISSYGKR